MKLLIFTFFVFNCLKCFCQQPVINEVSLSKYSYTIAGLPKISQPQLYMGTCFFINSNDNLFLITARHVLYDCDSLTKKLTCPNYLGVVFLTNPSEQLTFNIPSKSQDCLDFYKDTDLLVLPIDKKWLGRVYTIENFILPPFSKYGDAEIFGQGMSTDPKIARTESPHHIHLPENTFTIYYKTRIEKTFIDSIHYAFVLKELEVGDWLEGYSGSPIFVQDAISKKWGFYGIVRGSHDKESGIKKGALIVIKPKFVSQAIDTILSTSNY